MTTTPGKHRLTHDLKWEGVCSCGEEHIYRVKTTRGFTDSFSGKDIRVLIDLGLILHKEDGYDVVTGYDVGVGPLVRTFGP